MAFRAYDTALNGTDVEALFDVDEYFPDLLTTLAGMAQPHILLTGWLIVPSIMVRRKPDLTFQGLLVQELKKQGAVVRILWNTNYAGPYPGLRKIAAKLHREVVAAAKCPPGNFKIILSTNLEYELPDFDWIGDAYYLFQRGRHLVNRTNPATPIPANVREALQDLWLRKFPNDPASFRNLAAFTLGAHHQKTVTLLGDLRGKSTIRAYCGGIDFSGAPSAGGFAWHDAALRTQGANAVPVLRNFVERWNADLDSVIQGRTLAHGVADADRLDVAALTAGVTLATGAEDAVEARRTIPLEGWDWPAGQARVTECLDAYETWIPQATGRLFLTNQYFRSRRVAELLRDQLDDEPNLRVTIILPMYTEEMGNRLDLVKLREEYVAAPQPTRAGILARVADKGLTIDPMNKVTLYVQSQCLDGIVQHQRVRVWMAKPPVGIPYIHAKVMLADQAALMIGSANINGRSLLGLADTEINLLLTDPVEIGRIVGRQGWLNEPDSEQDANYKASWYGKHRLVRYTQAHWEVDAAYGAFPRGRGNLANYAARFRSDRRMDMSAIGFDQAAFAAAIQNFPLDSETIDFGELLANAGEHLI